MFPVLVVLFLAVPLAELWVIVAVADGLGLVPTLALLLVVSVVGAWMVRVQGFGALGRIQAVLARGEMPTGELVDGALIILAGALLLTPGFLTDTVGLLLLIPPTRAVARGFLVRRFRSRIRVGGFGPPRSERTRPPGSSPGPVVDAEAREPGARLDPPAEDPPAARPPAES
jgi:UPF0716 protein FxsA